MRSAAYLSVGLLVLALAGFNSPDRYTHELARSRPGDNDESGQLATSGLLASIGEGAAQQNEPPAERADIARPARPEPLRVALQAGHWKAGEAPNELSGLRDNGGTRGGGKNEWEVNLEIAELAGSLLEKAGYEVDVLPATVPERYQADAFVAIHADGNNDASVAGYRVGSPRRDATQRAAELAEVLAQAYGEATGIRRLPVATRRMRGYYAFRYNRYRHAIHPSTVGVIIETGFLTSPVDRRVIVDDPARAAQGIFEGVTRFLGPPTTQQVSRPPDTSRPGSELRRGL